MSSVTIYKVRCYQAYMADETGTSYAMSPWRGDTDTHKGETLSQEEYLMPKGFTRIADGDAASDQEYYARESLGAKFVDADGKFWALRGLDRPVLQLCELDGRFIALKKA